MTEGLKKTLLALLDRHKELGISEQLDYDKFYLYSIITHSTAIEGSTVTEVEAQLLFDEGITSSKRTVMEQMMNLDLKVAYEYGMNWIKGHQPITTEWLITLASKVMARTGSEYDSNLMTELHCRHLKADIDQYVESIEEKMVDKDDVIKKMVDKWSIRSSLAGKLADILLFMADKREVKTEDIVSHFGFTATTAKRYLRQLTEFGYLEARGGNKNRTYVPKESF